MPDIFFYGTDRLTSSKAIAIARGQLKASLNDEATTRVLASQDEVARIVSTGRTVYGVNTGFGILANKPISEEDTATLQYKILQSHSVGVGEPIAPEVSKLMLITKVQSLAQGYSGVQLSTLQRIIWHIDNDIIPVVPSQGSVGASGDLAPLAHLFLPLIGLGECWVNGEKKKAARVLQQNQLPPIQLGPKEGLALINGTQFILSFAVKAVQRMHNCLEAADIIGAMTLEALTGTNAPFDERLHKLRPYAGNRLVAQRLRLILHDSAIMQSHVDCGRVQDPYSLRCMPQVHGASRTAWFHLKELTETELNAVTDNPIIFSATDTISGGNFHGQPLALPLDYACFAAAEIGNISDRRCYLLLEGKWGLPMLLMKDVGLNSGFMIPQYTTAALVTENKTLCFPASADSIPTSLGQEDHVSMGSISGRKLNQVLDNLENILAIELLSACQAIEFRRPHRSSEVLEFAHDLVRNYVSFAEEDRIFAEDINLVAGLIKDFSFVEKVDAFTASRDIRLNEGYAEFTY
ncbi:MAG: histidine ammonia-lyase [Sphingobacteriales bacterium SCN 48-20]|jgi:histidine ammonia-lyase|uniref:histidine ammonia-lyase n=1 Tax=Terrimonas ferruginea TaxID=249 RepID=UPI00086F59EA|nr:histidine ammonia-lyase [Terrimonas ferruginea]MBN8784874.1 histidine ammonia-lyase [Terrimonas ferruginea]ODT95342.1 MAG: histidine ammonia-lyase [Sphingobacteriales bacterium SCN 48-20]OJW43724.1 MAG: histidine ammonia-lyase [Sphingobacteriales bacterium 48-107]